jgi:hypothetical protein
MPGQIIASDLSEKHAEPFRQNLTRQGFQSKNGGTKQTIVRADPNRGLEAEGSVPALPASLGHVREGTDRRGTAWADFVRVFGDRLPTDVAESEGERSAAGLGLIANQTGIRQDQFADSVEQLRKALPAHACTGRELMGCQCGD